MKYKIVAIALLSIFLMVIVFGLPVLLSHSTHHVGCPLQGAQTVMCENTTLEHVGIWHAMFAAIFGFVLALLGAAVLTRLFNVFVGERERLRLRVRQLATERPTLFQELYSSGILNRKEPAHVFVCSY